MRSRLTSSDLGGTPERRSRSRERPADPKTKMDHDRPEKSDDESDEGIDGIDAMEGGGEGDESMPFLPIPSDLRPDVVSSSGDNGFGSISYGDGEEESDSPEKRAFRVLAQYSPPDTEDRTDKRSSFGGTQSPQGGTPQPPMTPSHLLYLHQTYPYTTTSQGSISYEGAITPPNNRSGQVSPKREHGGGANDTAVNNKTTTNGGGAGGGGGGGGRLSAASIIVSNREDELFREPSDEGVQKLIEMIGAGEGEGEEGMGEEAKTVVRLRKGCVHTRSTSVNTAGDVMDEHSQQQQQQPPATVTRLLPPFPLAYTPPTHTYGQADDENTITKQQQEGGQEQEHDSQNQTAGAGGPARTWLGALLMHLCRSVQLGVLLLVILLLCFVLFVCYLLWLDRQAEKRGVVGGLGKPVRPYYM